LFVVEGGCFGGFVVRGRFVPNLSHTVQSYQTNTDSYLEIHESHQLLDLGAQHFDRLLVDFNSVRLLVGFYLQTRSITYY